MGLLSQSLTSREIAERFDHVLDGRRPRASDGKRPPAMNWRQKIIQLGVKAKAGGRLRERIKAAGRGLGSEIQQAPGA